VADIARDPQYLAREMILDVRTAGGESLKVPGIVPKMSATPGAIRHPAPRLGEHGADLGKGGWPPRGEPPA
jgi:crotonobetainyl-CoA:carnitine CoA-transferase CaiB-like acyl-CoA transferase